MTNNNFYSPIPFLAGTVVDGLLGACLVNLPVAIAAGTVGSIAAATALGAVVVYFPYALAQSLLYLTLAENAPYLYHGLSIALNLATAFYAGLVGAAILGLAAHPIALCALTGAIVFNTPYMIGVLINLTINILTLSFQGMWALASIPFVMMECLGASAQNMAEEINNGFAAPAPSAPVPEHDSDTQAYLLNRFSAFAYDEKKATDNNIPVAQLVSFNTL